MAGTALDASAAASSNAVLVVKRPMACRLRMVGKMTSMSPAR